MSPEKQITSIEVHAPGYLAAHFLDAIRGRKENLLLGERILAESNRHVESERKCPIVRPYIFKKRESENLDRSR